MFRRQDLVIYWTWGNEGEEGIKATNIFYLSCYLKQGTQEIRRCGMVVINTIPMGMTDNLLRRVAEKRAKDQILKNRERVKNLKIRLKRRIRERVAWKS